MLLCKVMAVFNQMQPKGLLLLSSPAQLFRAAKQLIPLAAQTSVLIVNTHRQHAQATLETSLTLSSLHD